MAEPDDPIFAHLGNLDAKIEGIIDSLEDFAQGLDEHKADLGLIRQHLGRIETKLDQIADQLGLQT